MGSYNPTNKCNHDRWNSESHSPASARGAAARSASLEFLNLRNCCPGGAGFDGNVDYIVDTIKEICKGLGLHKKIVKIYADISIQSPENEKSSISWDCPTETLLLVRP